LEVGNSSLQSHPLENTELPAPEEGDEVVDLLLKAGLDRSRLELREDCEFRCGHEGAENNAASESG
jgi:hypothetical protein